MEPNNESELIADENANAKEELPHVFLDRYKILEKIGKGGTGTVFKAQDLRLPRVIALKLLNSDKVSERNITRLHKEARTICQLQHANIVDIYDFAVTAKGEPLLAMEYVDGKPLDTIIEESGAMSLRDSLDVFLQICDAMDYAHSRGVLHRDLTPSNILMMKNARGKIDCKVVDFGIAKVEDLQENTISKTGVMVGTATVISPEQARGADVDQRSDVYSLGCLMYRVLTGKYPFLGKSTLETVQKQLNEKAPTLADGNPDSMYPSDLEEIVARALNKAPGDRFQSMSELRAMLDELFVELDTKVKRVGGLSGATTAILPVGIRQTQSTFKWFWLVPVVVAPLILLCIAFLMWEREPDPDFEKGQQLADYRTYSKNGQQWMSVKANVMPCLQALKQRPEIKRLDVHNLKLTDKEMKEIAKLPLVMIDLRDNEKLDDDSLQELSKCRTLKSILIRNSPNVTDKGVHYLTTLPELRILALNHTSITDKSVADLSKSNLYGLYLGQTIVTNDCIPFLLAMKELRAVKIGETKIDRIGVAKILIEKPLWFINIGGLKLKDEDLPPNMFDSYQMLDLSDNDFTDKVLFRLMSQKKIWFVDFRKCPGMTKDGISNFKKARNDKWLVTFYDEPKYAVEMMDTEGYLDPTCYELTIKDPDSLRTIFCNWQTDSSF